MRNAKAPKLSIKAANLAASLSDSQQIRFLMQSDLFLLFLIFPASMNMSNLSEAETTMASPQPTSHPPVGITTFTQTTYSILATIAIIGNTLVILVFIQDKKLLKKSYNMLILSLAIADVLTAIILITNPAFVLGDAFPYPTNPILSEIFCRVIWSRTFLFQLVVFSAYICLALATERWYAVIKPLKYNSTFNKKRTLIYIFLVWLWSLILCCTSLFEAKFVSSNLLTRQCTWQLYWGRQPIRAIVGTIQVFFKMALPCLAMLILFIHMICKASNSTVASADSRVKMRGKMTRMVGVACLMLTICFAPNQINYALAMAGKARLDSELHHILSLLVFVNSCLNPLIYGLSNKNYRRGYQNIFIFLFCCAKARRGGNKIEPATDAEDGTNNIELTQEMNRE